MIKNLLVTGPPGCGKTTLVRKISEDLRDLPVAGFYTDEIREGGERVGFALVGLDGRRGILSHVRTKGPPRVGKYGVDIAGFEAFLGDPRFGDRGIRLVILDEIGKMECLSPRFRDVVGTCLGSPVPLLATIALHGTPSIEEIKARPDVRVIVMTREDREEKYWGVREAVRNLVGT